MRLSSILAVIALFLTAATSLQARTGFAPHFGFGVNNVRTPAGQPGLRISNVEQGSLAEQAGLRPGMIIVSINGEPAPSDYQLGDRFRELWDSDTASMDFEVMDLASQQIRTLSIRLPVGAASKSSISTDVNGDRMTVVLAPPPVTFQDNPDPRHASPPRRIDTRSPAFVRYDFLCRVSNGQISASKDGHSYWYQLTLAGTPITQSSAIFYYDSNHNLQRDMVWDITNFDLRCQGGTATDAQISAALGLAQAHHTELKNGRLYHVESFLTEGAGFLPFAQPTYFDHWDDTHNQFTFDVAGALPDHAPTAPMALLITRIFSGYAPWPQYFVAVAFLVLLVPLLASYKPLPAETVSGIILVAIATVVLACGLVLTTKPADTATLQSFIDEQMVAAHTAADQINKDRITLASLTPSADGYVEPFTQETLDRAQRATGLHYIPAIVMPRNPDIWLWLMLAPFVVLLGFAHRVVLGATYFLTPHAPTDIIQPILSTGSAIYPNSAILDALDTPIEDIITPPPLRHTQSMVARGRELMHRIKQDREISEASAERDMARADMLEARERIRQARAKLPWWRRWFT